jgi:hypothetical protein
MAAPGPPPRAEAGPSVVTDVRGPASNEAAAAAELLMLLGDGEATTAMATRLGFLQDALFNCGVPEELARREMLELASKNGIFTAAVAAIDPDISPELCVERGWPASCFTACECARLCMKILATQDGEFFDEQLRLLREAHAAAEADADARMPRAKRAVAGAAAAAAAAAAAGRGSARGGRPVPGTSTPCTRWCSRPRPSSSRATPQPRRRDKCVVSLSLGPRLRLSSCDWRSGGLIFACTEAWSRLSHHALEPDA